MDRTPLSSASRSSFHSLSEILNKLQSVGFCSDLDFSNLVSTSGDNLGCLFDMILFSFFKKSCKRGEMRLLPATLGDGSSIDLFKLYSIVQREGGYDAATKERKWKSVAEAMGLDSFMGPSLKLVFLKYLDVLDQWLQWVEGRKEIREPKRHKNAGAPFVSYGSCGTINHKKVGESTPPLNMYKDQSLELGNAQRNGKDVTTFGGFIANGGSNHKMTKESPLAKMLNWLRMSAKCPGHPSLANTLTSNKNKNNSSTVGKFYAQALLAIQARSFRRSSRSSSNLSLPQIKAARSEDSLESDRRVSSDQQRAKIPIGGKFQATIPDWTGRPLRFCNDFDTSKWLGTRTWPSEDQQTNELLEYAAIGRGRRNTCQCEQPQSMECIRCHIAEKRLQLKCELGRAFHDWDFKSMGEEVAFSWTKEEEKKFRDAVFQSQPSLNENFWDKLYINCPSKTRRNLVSYYFNVFLLGRRRHQNFVTPKNIDSDDEVTEFDFSSHSVRQLTEVPDHKTLVCVQNQQCMDIDEDDD
ncbi:AT-rich interactive domain-containing protein 2-like [Zingiber officinale]|uniref:AT-rich interactive domain-containing protein 2 n=1 Tax=Zingiber officinale TaxID=94328 RepID=A0A8J5GBW6_ZINOF|nr:AT-rich interactive domain-containing protein 2-like [Zingiber officinale]KAG6501854.1 hypothetical protein ZIOFF_041738 [Zingiber officinale]